MGPASKPDDAAAGTARAASETTQGDLGRALYVGACRIDLFRREGASRLLTDAHLARTVARALEAAGAPAPASVTVVLTDDEELRDLNRAHLDKDEPTDVVSFPMLPPGAYPDHAGKPSPDRSGGSAVAAPAPLAPVSRVPAPRAPAPGRDRIHLGDIAISVERAVEQAESGRGGQTGDVRWSPADEIRLLVTHGVLHVCGWDHADPEEEAAMRSLEQRLLAEDRR